MPCRTWLPSGVRSGAAIERRLAETCRAWSDHWFARRLMRSVGSVADCDSAELARLRALDLRFLGQGLGLAVEAGAAEFIAGMMLDEAVGGPSRTPADEALIGRLAGACLDDLGLRLASAFGLPTSAPWRRGEPDSDLFRGTSVGTFGASESHPLVRILAAPDLVAGLVKSSASPAGKTIRLRPLGEGLAKQRIGLSARVGQCALTLGEFAGLAPGDVLVLDTPLQAALPLAVDGAAGPGRCTVEPAATQLSLKIVQPLTRTGS